MKMQTRLHTKRATALVPTCDWHTTIQNLGAKGVIFDCDGTLIESSSAQFSALQAAAQDQGFNMSEDWYDARTGLDRKTLFSQFKQEIAPSLDTAAANRVSIQKFADYVSMVTPIAATVALLKDLSARGMPLAVATNSEREIAMQSLGQVGLLDAVGILVSVSDGLPPKPAPDMFTRAATRMKLSAQDVIVFEDSHQGVQAALSAGMPVFEIGSF